MAGDATHAAAVGIEKHIARVEGGGGENEKEGKMALGGRAAAAAAAGASRVKMKNQKKGVEARESRHKI